MQYRYLLCGGSNYKIQEILEKGASCQFKNNMHGNVTVDSLRLELEYARNKSKNMDAKKRNVS